MENWLASGDQIDAVASNNDEMAIGALSAIDAAGKLGKILVGGVDASPDALAEIDKGRLNVTVFQNAKGQGYGGIKAAALLALGQKVPENRVWIPYELVTPDNYKNYMKGGTQPAATAAPAAAATAAAAAPAAAPAVPALGDVKVDKKIKIGVSMLFDDLWLTHDARLP